MKRVIIDANALRAGGWPHPKPLLTTLFSVCSELKIAVVLPEVVEIELKGRFERDLREKHSAASKAINDVNRVLDRYGVTPASPIELPDVDRALEAYQSSVDELIAAHGIERAALPAVSLAVLVRQAAVREAPFNSAGEGFRDALVVHTVDAGAASEGVLLTGDKDFLGEPALLALAKKAVSVERSTDTLVDSLQQRLSAARQRDIQLDIERAALVLGDSWATIEQKIRGVPFQQSDLMLPVGSVEVDGITAIFPTAGFRNVRVARQPEGVLISATVDVHIVLLATTRQVPTGPLPVAATPEEFERIALLALMGRETPPNAPLPSATNVKVGVQVDAIAREASGKFVDLELTGVKPLSLLAELIAKLQEYRQQAVGSRR